MKKVSVIIPLYNSGKYIEETIKSVLNQTYKNIETIVVDDGSTDDSLSVAKKFESENVKIYTQTHHGACRARNMAFNLSTGDYIQYLDADDLLAPNKIEKQVEILKKNGVNCITYCGYTRNRQEFTEGLCIQQGINRDYSNPVELYVDIFNGKGNIITLCWLTPRQLIEHSDPWNERLLKLQDGEFFVKVAMKCKKIIFSKDTIVFYRPTGQTSVAANQSIQAIESVILATELIESTILQYEDSVRVRYSLSFIYSKIFCAYYNKHNSKVLERVLNNIYRLGGKLRFDGNKAFGLLSHVIGIKNTLTLKRNTKKILRITGY